jgi:hypothetical protein
MKEINNKPFGKKKEQIAFSPSPVPNRPEPLKTNERSNVRSQAGYVVAVPTERRKTRQSFDIYEDQYDALKKLQLAVREHSRGKAPKLGEMVQEAIDQYVREQAKRLPNITVIAT